MTIQQRLWNYITTPSPHLKDDYEREQAILQSATLFALSAALVLFGLSILIFPIVAPHFIPSTLLNVVIFIGFYGISRSRYYSWGMRFTIWFSILSLVLTIKFIAVSPPIFLFDFFVIPVLLAGFFFRVRESVIITLVTISLAIFLEMDLYGGVTFFSTPLLLIQVGLLSIVGSLINRQYQQRAIKNEDRYRSLMQANYEGILVINADDACIIDVNDAVKRVTGYSRDELLHRYPIEFVAATDKQLVRDAWNRRATNTPFEIDFVHQLGYTIYLEVRLRPYKFQGQDSYVVTMLDITDRKYAEMLIIESEQRFRMIFNGSSHYIAVLDEKGKIFDLNNPAYEAFGLKPADVLGNYLWEFSAWTPSDEVSIRMRSVVEEALKGAMTRHEIIAHDKDGKTIYLDVSLSPLITEAGDTKLIIVEARDVTAKRKAESQRHELENRYLTLFNNTTDAVFILSMDGVIQDANDKALHLLQTTYDEVIGKNARDYVLPEDQSDSEAAFDRLQQGDAISRIERRSIQRHDKTNVIVETMGLTVHSDHTEPYILSMLRDITDRVRMQEERFQTAIQRDRNQFLEHFIENASHHFRTPITNMKTRMYILPRVFDKPEKRAEQIDILNQELERLQNILNDLLMVLRLQKEDTEYSITRLSVNQLIAEVRQSFEGRSEYQHYHWRWQLSSEDVKVFADRSHLAQAMVQIVENALTHTPESGTIKVIAAPVGAWITINIIDSGDGIAPEDLSNIFRDFYRGQDAMEQDSTSSGLGLTIVKLIVERLGGRIFVSSTLGQGTHIQIALPNIAKHDAFESPMPTQMLTLTLAE